MAETFLFVGTILLAFQYVGDIGYVSTLLAMPFALPLPPLMKKLGYNFNRVSTTQLGFEINEKTPAVTRNKFVRGVWWLLFICTVICFGAVFLITQPIMWAYFLIGRPLLAINKALNIIYRTSISPWNMIYLTMLQWQIRWVTFPRV